MADVGCPGIAGCPGLGAGRLSFSTGGHAQEPEPPPGDCWNGALSKDPLHCYIFEEAQRAGEIDIAVVYVAPGDGPLYIFLSQTEPIGPGAISYLRAKTYEYLETVERWHPSGPGIKCFDHTGDERRSCFDNVIGRPTWDSFGRAGVGSLPHSRVYEDIVLDVGGVEARRTKIGWASWRQLWPAPGPTGASGASSGFDVSDVDTTNVPEPDCDEYSTGTVMRGSCLTWEYHVRAGYNDFGGGYLDEYGTMTSYLHIKNAPTDEAELEALKAWLAPEDQRYGFEVEIISVKYDFGQLWRWSVILDRLALSAGNTIGIVGAIVDINTDAHSGIFGGKLVWMNGVEPAGLDESRSHMKGSAVRNIVVVYALDPDRVASALPELLPLLGIPVDAVGLVAHADSTPVRSEPLGGEEVFVDKEHGPERSSEELIAEYGHPPPPERIKVTLQSSVETGDSGSKPVAASRSNSSAEKTAPGSETATEPDSSTVPAAKSDGEVTSEKTAPGSETATEPDSSTVPAAKSDGEVTSEKTAPGSEAATEPDSSTVSPAKSGGEVTSEKTAPGSEAATEPDSSTVPGAKSGEEVTSVKTATESKAGASPEPETDSVAIPNRGDSGGLDAPSADATVVPDPMVSRWVLVSVGGAVALAVAGSVVFVGVRRVRRRS